MIEAIKEDFNILDQLTHGLGFSILIMFPISLRLNALFRIVKILCGATPYITEKPRTQPIRAEPAKVNLKKETLDNDLKKYFNYDVKR